MTGDRGALIAGLVEKVREEVGGGWPSVWQVVCSHGAVLFKRFPALDRAAFTRSEEHKEGQYPLIRALDEVLRVEGDDRPLVLEVAVDGVGGVEFTYGFAPSEGPPYSVVLDHRYRYPNHPLPGMPQPVAARPTGLPTDPGVLRHVESLVREFTDHFVRLKGCAPEFGPVRTEEELAAAEAEMGVRLPEDVRALYRVIGDDLRENGVLGRCYLEPLPSVVQYYLDGVPGCWGWQDDLFALERVVLEAEPHGAVRRVSRNDWWVIVASDHAGSSFAVDLDPEPGGRSGQLIEYGGDFDAAVGYAGKSVTAVLESVLDALRRGQVSGEEGDRFGLVVDVPPTALPEYTVAEHVAYRDVAEVLAEVPDPATVQKLYLNHADSLDLRALSVLPRVRSVIVNRAGSVRPWLPQTVEALSLEAREADLSALAGHPVLWDLTVSGMPVSVADLAALPALSFLDVAGADVDHVEALADLDVRVLCLNSGQWQRLRAAGRVPERLAGAQLADDVRATEALDWTSWLTDICAAG